MTSKTNSMIKVEAFIDIKKSHKTSTFANFVNYVKK